jgi:beta-lactamase regulating signal transducer with metallopeptidase domain
MTPLFALRMLLFAGELLAGSILIMSLGWALSSQKRASARHLAWAGAFGAALLLPLFLAIMPSPLRILLPAPAEMIPVQSLSQAAMAATLPVPADSGITLDPATIALALGALWLLGIAVLAARFAVAALCLAALRHRSRPFALAPEDLPRVAATRRECELRISDSENGPITWGILSPVILLPRTAVFWPRERLHAVLLHELAHIRRRDSLVQALSLFVCTLYWPNPLVWLGARALRREAEISADDSVLRAGVKPSTYAGELLELASEFRMRTPALSALSLFMASPSALEARVESVLEPTSLRTGVTSMDVIRIAGLGFVAAGVVAFACPSLAQDSQPAPVETAPLPPVAPDAPPALQAAPAPEVPDAPPAPAAPEAPPAPQASWHTHVHMHALTRAERERIHNEVARAEREARRAVAEARVGEEAARAVKDAQPAIDAAMATAAHEAHDAMASVGPEVERALADAKIGEQATRAVREAQPDIDAAMDEAMAKYDSRKVRLEVDRALADAQKEIAKAHIDAKIQERVNEALERAQRKVDAASARVRGRDSDDENNDSSSDNDQ